MCRFPRVAVALFAAFILASAGVALPCAACAVPLGDTVLLPFGGVYRSADGRESVHRGIDVAFGPGLEVDSPVSGRVSFAGRIPSASGGTMFAVSIEYEGDVVSLSPLASVAVSKGRHVEAGDPIGVSSGHGDLSSSEPHLHVSLRRAGVYLDPSGLLSPVPAPEQRREDEPAPVGIMPDVAPAQAAVHAVAVPEPVPAAVEIAPAHLTGAESVARQQKAPVAAPYALEPAVSPGGEPAEAAPGSEPPPSAASVPGALSRSVPGLSAVAGSLLAWRRSTTCEPSPVRSLAPGVSLVGPRTERPAPPPTHVRSDGHIDSGPPSSSANRWVAGPAVSLGGASAVLTVVFALIALFMRQELERRFRSNPPVSHRFGSMLQHLRAGDTLCGLTSCSGLLPSQSRGRLAQRR